MYVTRLPSGEQRFSMHYDCEVIVPAHVNIIVAKSDYNNSLVYFNTHGRLIVLTTHDTIGSITTVNPKGGQSTRTVDTKKNMVKLHDVLALQLNKLELALKLDGVQLNPLATIAQSKPTLIQSIWKGIKASLGMPS